MCEPEQPADHGVGEHDDAESDCDSMPDLDSVSEVSSEPDLAQWPGEDAKEDSYLLVSGEHYLGV